MKINLIEMEGLLRGQCIPGDLIVNETLAEYLVRKFDVLNEQLSESRREFTAANATIHNLELRLADAEARGVEKFANALRHKGDDEFLDAIAVVHADVADKFAAQLRQGAEK